MAAGSRYNRRVRPRLEANAPSCESTAMIGASRITLLNDAKLCLRNGRVAQAERFLQQALQNNPQDVEAMTLLGAVAFQVGAWDQADSIFQRCHDLEPREPSHLINLAKVRVTTGRLKDAVAMFDL